MKNPIKIFGILAFIILSALSVTAQDEEIVFEETKETPKFQRSYFPPREAGWWTLGINGGWAYQSSDVPTTFQGYGFGMTLAKNLYYRPGSPISFDARGRWLYSQSIGLDTKRAIGLENNDALNGTREAGEGLDYTIPNGPGYVFQNHKTHQFELGLEGVLTANRLRERTGIIASIYGGLNLDWYNVKLDQADNGGIYDYSGIDHINESKSQIKTILNEDIRDGVYETNAHGFEGGAGKIGFMPSLGLELGYQFTPKFSMHVGHKFTFPLNDELDGELWKDDNNLTGDNDLHHYTNLGMRWIIDPGTNTMDPPIINVTYPGTNPYVSNVSAGRVEAKIKNVRDRNDIRCYVNGNPHSFSFSKGRFRTNFPLQYGNNEILITATNQVGSDEETVIIYFGDGGSNPPVVNNDYAPQVNITNPRSERYTSDIQNININANIKYVANKNDIEFRVNGQNNYNFNYDHNRDQFSANIRLKEGRNEIEIIGRNQVGSDRDNVIIFYEKKVDLPRVNITSPARSPHETDLRNISIRATLENVTSKNDIRFFVNGQERSLFNYDSRRGLFNVDIQLVDGRNEVTVKGYNEAGNDQDQVTIIYKDDTPSMPPPRVNITQPSQNYSEVNDDRTTIQAILENVTSKNDIRFYVNGSQTSAFNYDSRRGRFSASINLREGQNTVRVKGFNQVGEAQDEVTIVYKRTNVPTMEPPVVTITSVSAGTSNPMDPNSQLCRTTIVATILNVTSKSDVVFRINGQKRTDFTFNVNTKKFKSSLITLSDGNNLISIKGFNAVGDDEDTVNKNCEVTASNPPVVTINNPTNNSTSSSATTNLNARVKNVQQKSDITVRVNGTKINNFSFSPVSKVVTASISLKDGNNKISVFGKNNDGTDEASVNVRYNAPKNPPRVDITQPSNNATTDTKTAVVKAKILNVNSKNDIRFTFNGSNTSNFSYNTSSKILTANVSLKEGTNTITIKATNADGNDSETVRVKYIAAKNPPIVDITQPSNNSSTNKKDATVKAKILNINSKNDIRFTLNGKTISNFSYSTSSKIFTANVSLKEGTNTITIKATNADGNDSETVRVKYNAPKVLPTVNISSPKNNSKTQKESATVKATIKNISSKSDVTFLFNGKRVSSFTLRGTQFSAQVKLKDGRNTIKITVQNKDGNDSDQVNVTLEQKVVTVLKPTIKFTNPKRPGKKAKAQKVTVKASVTNIKKKNQLKVMHNGKNIDFSFNVRSKEISVPVTLKTGNNTFLIKATNSGGTATAETSLKYTPRVAQESKPFITITSVSTPTANPFNPNISGSTIIGNVKNISRKDQIKISHNGNEITDFTFDTRSKVFQVSISLANGETNKVKITATNGGGTATKEHTY